MPGEFWVSIHEGPTGDDHTGEDHIKTHNISKYRWSSEGQFLDGLAGEDHAEKHE